jgi:tRNA 2-thiouridine synthesizing protein B
MPTLHTVNKSPYERNALKSCLEHSRAGDIVLLIEDGVLAAHKCGAFSQELSEKKSTGPVYALSSDLAARGIKTADVAEGIEIVDYAGFVDLATKAKRVCAWL